MTKENVEKKVSFTDVLHNVVRHVLLGVKMVYTMGKYAMPPLVWILACRADIIGGLFGTTVGVMMVFGAIIAFVMNELVD